MEPTEDCESISKMLEEDFSVENKDTDESIVFIATKLQDKLDNNLNDIQESANILEKDDNTEKSAEKNTYSDDNDSDNIPLADLVRQRQRKCKRSLFKGDSSCSESELDTDDDVADPTYRITKKRHTFF
ncbi:hypothetical protein DPMN_041410 [Dreissena polymorpha]|uniref:Uncharacterized protein n=1 Tax=Dreissena polymorpha TaxID=45954 RepID=A0A9D4HTW6_DREPO|nr:hypothetical protein DPMN_041410 [Dreissena polymorpha]